MRNNPDFDSNLALVLGLLGATIVAALVVLILPAVVGPNVRAQALPSPEIITATDRSALETTPAYQRLPKAQRPPETLLDPAGPSTLASKD